MKHVLLICFFCDIDTLFAIRTPLLDFHDMRNSVIYDAPLRSNFANNKNKISVNTALLEFYWSLGNDIIVPQDAEDFNRSMLFSIPWDHHRRILIAARTMWKKQYSL